MTPVEQVLELELSMVDPDIAANHRRIGSTHFRPGLALQMQIARSLKEIIPILMDIIREGNE